MKKIIILGALADSLMNFRGELLHALTDEGHDVIAMADMAEPDLVKRLSAIGVTFHPYPVQRNGLNPLADLRTLFALRKTFRALKPDIVLSYTIKPVIWGGIALKGISNSRLYAMITGLGFTFSKSSNFKRWVLSKLVTQLYKIALAKVSTVIFQNSDNLDVFISRKIIAKNKCVIVNGSGVNINKFFLTPLP
jgi:hypothetical protein